MRFFRSNHCKPGRILGWNLMFLLWGAALLAALAHVDSLPLIEKAPEGRVVSVTPLPEPEAMPAQGRQPLDAYPGNATQPLTAIDALTMTLVPRPEHPPVVTAYPNPGYDPESGMAHYRQASLAWLTHHQNSDGFWDADGFSGNSCRAGAAITGGEDQGDWDSDLTVTSLALLTYLGAGYDHKEGDFRRNCRQAIIWLRDNQRNYGFESARGVRDHALALMALSEAYGLSGDSALKPIADAAVLHLLNYRQHESGWGEYVGYPADIISTAYAVLAIKSARISGLEFDADLTGLSEFLDEVAEDEDTHYGRYAKVPPCNVRDGHVRPAVCTAAWVLAKLLNVSGYAYRPDDRIDLRAALLAKPENLPSWEPGRIDFEYWWLGCMAAYQVGGECWKAWEPALSKALLENQRGCTAGDKQEGLTADTALDEHGSWDTADIWNRDGRVAATALASLCLEVYYRYQRIEEVSDEVVEDE